MKSCELCKLPARMYCESDEASLCWACDAKVHGANFLVARHTRSLLCNSCQSPTPWKASGPKLGPTVSVCERCADGREEEEESDGGNDDEIDAEDDIDESAEDDIDESDDAEEEEVEVCVDDDDDDDEDGDGDNQVVPWSSTPPPPAASPSSSEDSDGGVSESETVFSLKRKRESDSDRRLQEDLGCSSSRQEYGSASAAMAAVTSGDGEATCVDSSSSRPLKGRKTEPNRTGSKSAAIIESLKRFYHHDISSGNNASDSSKETRAVD